MFILVACAPAQGGAKLDGRFGPVIFFHMLTTVLAALAACGTSGVAGGSLPRIPMACSLFGVSNDVAMQVVGVGGIIGVARDSVETALNSSRDVLIAATAGYRQWLRQGRPLPAFLGGAPDRGGQAGRDA